MLRVKKLTHRKAVSTDFFNLGPYSERSGFGQEGFYPSHYTYRNTGPSNLSSEDPPPVSQYYKRLLLYLEYINVLSTVDQH